MDLARAEVLNGFPGIHASKDLDGKYLHSSNDHSIYTGFKSSKHFFEHERTDYNLRTKVVECAAFFSAEDKRVVDTQIALKIIGFYDYKEGIRCLLGEKGPVYNKENTPCGVFFNFIDVTATQLESFFINHVFPSKKIKQGTHYLKSSFDNKILTDRESECLFHILRGKSAKMTADILGLSVRTVETYLEKIKFKLHCDNKSQVIEKALGLGYYYVIPESLIKI